METAWDSADSVLDLCVTAIQQQGKTVEDCLDRYGGQVDGLELLLRLTVRLQAGQAVKASPEFRQAAAGRLREAAAARPVAGWNGITIPAILLRLAPGRKIFPSRTGASLSFRLLLAGLILALLILSGTGAVAASAQALPGDFLYPIKRAHETIQLTLSSDEASQAHLHLEMADRRMTEALALLSENRPVGLNQALADYNEQMQTELNYFDRASQLSPGEQAGLATSLLSDLTNHQSSLASINKDAPQLVKTNMEKALLLSQTASARAAEILKENNGGQPLPGAVPTGSITPLPSEQTNLIPASGTPVPTHPPIRSTLASGLPTVQPTGRPADPVPTETPTPEPTLKPGSYPPGGGSKPGTSPTPLPTRFPSITPPRAGTLPTVKTPPWLKTPPFAITPPLTGVPVLPWPTLFPNKTQPGSSLPATPTLIPTNAARSTRPRTNTPTLPVGTPVAWGRPASGFFFTHYFNQPASVPHNRRSR